MGAPPHCTCCAWLVSPYPGVVPGWGGVGKHPASSGVRAGVPSSHGHHLVVPWYMPHPWLQQVMPQAGRSSVVQDQAGSRGHGTASTTPG